MLFWRFVLLTNIWTKITTQTQTLFSPPHCNTAVLFSNEQLESWFRGVYHPDDDLLTSNLKCKMRHSFGPILQPVIKGSSFCGDLTPNSQIKHLHCWTLALCTTLHLVSTLFNHCNHTARTVVSLRRVQPVAACNCITASLLLPKQAVETRQYLQSRVASNRKTDTWNKQSMWSFQNKTPCSRLNFSLVNQNYPTLCGTEPRVISRSERPRGHLTAWTSKS